jgi:hypothetical protein
MTPWPAEVTHCLSFILISKCVKQGPFIHYKTCNDCSAGACHCLLFYCTVFSSSFLLFLALHELSTVGCCSHHGIFKQLIHTPVAKAKRQANYRLFSSVHPTHLEAASDQVMQWLRVHRGGGFGPGDSATVNASKHRQFWVRCNQQQWHPHQLQCGTLK